MKVTICQWHAVASWTWTTEEDLCGICHQALDGCAPGASGPGDDSPVVWGKCSHYFHLMCITTWLHNKNSCPICRRKWEFASAPKPAPATPGVRRQGEGFSAAAAAATEPIAPPEPVEAD